MTGNPQCLHLGEGPSRACSTPAATVASLFLQVWRVWFEGRDGIRSDWVGIREVFPAGPQTSWLFPWSQRGPSSDLLERVDEPSQSTTGAWPLAWRCHPDRWAGPRPQEVGGPAQAHPIRAEGWLEGWLPGHVTGAVPEGRVHQRGIHAWGSRLCSHRAEFSIISSLNPCFVSEVQGYQSGLQGRGSSPPTPPALGPTLPQAPPCLLVPRAQSSHILPAPTPKGGAQRWLSLLSAGSTTGSPSALSTKCVPVLRVPPVRVGVMAPGKGREVSCLPFALGPANCLAGPVCLGRDRGATTLKAALCCPPQEGGLTLCPSAGQQRGSSRKLLSLRLKPPLGDVHMQKDAS